MIDTLGIVGISGGCAAIVGIVALYRAVRTAGERNCTLTISLVTVRWAPPTPQQKKAAAERPSVVRDQGAA